MSAARGTDYLLSLRDRLMDELDDAGVTGVISAGVGRVANGPSLVLLVRPNFRGGAPTDIEDVPIVVREMKGAAA